mmetsp:Transcript_31931/g.88932  ORF Transcript_31931/g.88932 Transcript_31931/m.88932 type:complete len:207 (-) Transcript_31931:1055-1675(-)
MPCPTAGPTTRPPASAAPAADAAARHCREPRPARMTSSTSSICEASTEASVMNCRLTRALSHTPSSSGYMGSPERMSRPAGRPLLWYSSCTLISVSLTSKPLFSASTLGTTSSASANACTPSLALPVTPVFLKSSRSACSATSKAPPPATTAPSSIALVTARRPSRVASLSIAMVCALGPLSRMVQLVGWRTSSTKVYFSSPRVCS